VGDGLLLIGGFDAKEDKIDDVTAKVVFFLLSAEEACSSGGGGGGLGAALLLLEARSLVFFFAGVNKLTTRRPTPVDFDVVTGDSGLVGALVNKGGELGSERETRESIVDRTDWVAER